MSHTNKYVYSSLENYFNVNSKIIERERKKHQLQQKKTYYTVNVQFFNYYKMFYIVIPRNYLNNIDYLRKNKMDIFAKGKILTFTRRIGKYRKFSFDAVIDSSEEDLYRRDLIYAYLVPIKQKYQKFNFRKKLLGTYTVEERIGDLTYKRMNDALDDFTNGGTCSEKLENYILGENDYYLTEKKYLDDIFNYNRYYPSIIQNYIRINWYQKKKIDKIFYKEMNTIQINSNEDLNIIGLIIYAIYQMRNYIEDKILICSSSNSSADSIALELMKIKKNVKNFNILRVYAKNQEIIKRNELLDEISYHKLLMKEENRDNNFGGRNNLIEENDIIISTCVNSYCDEIINYEFPFVIIVDANNSNENENLIPITLNAKYVLLISYEENGNDDINLYKRMKFLYPQNHISI